MKCNRADCNRDATHQIGMKLWALGVPRDLHQPATGYLSLVVCNRCKHDTKLKDILTPEGKAQLQDAFTRMRKAPPDFERAEITFTKIEGGKLKGGL